MKREQLVGHSQVSTIGFGCMSMPIDEELPESDIARLLRLVYTDGEGHINGDISAYLSEKTSPELREYIRQNILLNVSPADVSFPAADDATIETFIRDNGESAFEYRDRVANLFEQYVNDFKSLRENMKLKKEKDG